MILLRTVSLKNTNQSLLIYRQQQWPIKRNKKILIKQISFQVFNVSNPQEPLIVSNYGNSNKNNTVNNQGCSIAI